MITTETNINPFEYYDGKLCVQGGWLYQNKRIMSKPNYKKLKRSERITVVQTGAGMRPALISYESLPPRFKEKIVEYLGVSPYELYKSHWFESYLSPANKVKTELQNYTLSDGRGLPTEVIIKYTTQAMFLNAINIVKKEKRRLRKLIDTNERFDFWDRISTIVNYFNTKYHHDLPDKPGSLRNKFSKYFKNGYTALISRKYNNTNSLKSIPMVEKIILSFYCADNLPHAKRVAQLYNDFLRAKKEIIDKDTGEFFEIEQFYKNGNPLSLSESTVNNILNKPKYKDLIASMRKDYSKYKLNNSPYVRRKLPEFSMSKISVDDRFLRKTVSGRAVWMYAAYEPLSQCFIATAFDDHTEGDIVMSMFRDLYSQSIKHGLYWAGEIEHEHHLMNEYTEMMDALFTFRRACNPSNSREKRIEHGFKLLKYGAERDVFENVGRWHAKGEVYRQKENWKEYRNFNEVVADEKKAIELHNNTEHPHFPGKTRWQVLLENMNPDLSLPQKFRIMRYIGNKDTINIRINDFIHFQYEDYYLDRNRLHLLKPYTKKVDVYWLPDENGSVNEGYVYQDETFICKANKVVRFNESLFEQTETDKEIQLQQQKRLAKHLKHKKSQKEKYIIKPVIIDTDKFKEADDVKVKVIETPVKQDLNDDDILKQAQSMADYAEELAENNF